MSNRVLVTADWINLEGRLTAYFSGDVRLQEMLDGELRGEPKVHALTAAMLYGCDPRKAKEVMIDLQGQRVTAYYGGKRLRHGWHYGMKPRKMAQTFWIPIKEAEKHNEVLTAEHPDVVEWWRRLGDEVFGVPSYHCPRCDKHVLYQQQDCTDCRIGMRWAGYHTQPSNMLYTPFGRRRIYLGRRSESMNALISQNPQSSGASMWYRTLGRLHGVGVGDTKWPILPDTRVWWEKSYKQLKQWREDYQTQVNTGTYDSFLLETDEERVDEVVQWLTWTMEQAWPQLGGLRIPADVEVGYNWGHYDAGSNPRGLRGYDYKPFSSTGPGELG